MAEILGVVAGVVGIAGFAGQIAGGAIKLRELHRIAKGADQELDALYNDIALFATVLEQAECQAARSPVPVPPSLNQCHLSCTTLIAKLDFLVQDLEESLGKRRYSGEVKFAFKRNDVRELRDALTRAQQPLMLALLTFSHESNRQVILNLGSELKAELQSLRLEWSTRTTADLQIDRSQSTFRSPQAILASSKQVQDENIEPIQISHTLQVDTTGRPKIKENRTQMAKTRFVLPFSWFGRRWAFEMSKVSQSWDHALRVYNVIPRDSLPFNYARAGDVAGLRVMFDAKLASPFDIECRRGQTLLHHAADNDQPQVVQFLIEQGADVNTRDWQGQSCFEAFWSGDKERDGIGGEKALSILPRDVSATLQMIVKESDSLYSKDESFLRVMRDFSWANSPADILFIQKGTYPSYTDISLGERTLIAYSGSTYAKTPGRRFVPTSLEYVDDFFSVLGQKELDAACYKELFIKKCIFKGLRTTGSTRHGQLQAWRSLLRSMLLELADDVQVVIAFWTVLEEAFDFQLLSAHVVVRALNGLLHLCIKEFVLAGIDLKRLYQIVSRHPGLRGDSLPLLLRVGRRARICVHLINVTLGPNIEDWKVWISWPLDEWAGDFWNWVESPEEFLPGSWIEDPCSDDEYDYCENGRPHWPGEI